MPRQSSKLSRQEIALIKAMLNRGIPRQDILAYFSRPGRSINMFRIAEIRSKKVQGDIPAATDEELSKFISEHDLIFSRAKAPSGPLDDEVLEEILRLASTSPLKLTLSENESIEFKEQFNWASPEHYAKTMAAFSNNKGGYILFGINDAGVIVGARRDKFEKVDSGKISQFLNRHFQPAICWDRVVKEICGNSICIFYTYPADKGPIICVSDKQDVIKDGDIYFRYNGRNDRIKSAEYRHIINIHEQKIAKSWSEKFAQMSDIGLRNVGILNSSTGKIDGPSGPYFIDKSLIDHINFIQEGNFKKSSGAPTLKLVGEVQVIDSDPQSVLTIKEPTAIGESAMISAFIHQTPVPGAKEYIRSATLRQVIWTPLYYFIFLSDITIAKSIEIIENERGGYTHIKEKLCERLKNNKIESLPIKQNISSTIEKILNRSIISLEDRKEAGHFLYAILTLKENEVDPGYLLPIIQDCFDKFFFAGDQHLKGHLRKAISYLDYWMYASKCKTEDDGPQDQS